jgi:CHAT domain-containing protein/tetratricopeptide (TPR) repeat protein
MKGYFRQILHFLDFYPVFFAVCLFISSGLNLYGFTDKYLPISDLKVQFNLHSRDTLDLKKINEILKGHVNRTYAEPVDKYVSIIRKMLTKGPVSLNKDLAQAFYYCGICSLDSLRYEESQLFFHTASKMLTDNGLMLDPLNLRCIYSLSVNYGTLGNISESISYGRLGLELLSKLTGEMGPFKVAFYQSLSSAYMNGGDYERSLESANKGIETINSPRSSIDASIAMLMYQTRGAVYLYMRNYEKARYNLEKAEGLCDPKNVDTGTYINILNNLGTVFHYQSEFEKSYRYYEKGIKYQGDNLDIQSFSIIKNYAQALANDKNYVKGKKLISDFIDRAEKTDLKYQRNFILMNVDYADYLTDYSDDTLSVKEVYKSCYRYLKTHPWDRILRVKITIGYSKLLERTGRYKVALDSLQNLLYADTGIKTGYGMFVNPSKSVINPSLENIDVLEQKIRILKTCHSKFNEFSYLKAAAETSETLIYLVEKIRLNIGEDKSRIALGNKFRDVYIGTIDCYSDCYNQTGDIQYLRKIFEYSEKSKVASLLASTREMKAIQAFIPEELASYDKKNLRTIDSLNSKIAGEEQKEDPDEQKMKTWKDEFLIFTDKRDSLINVFEKKFPDYFAQKYNTNVVNLDQIPKLFGRNDNYLNYVLSDSIIYILLSNRRKCVLIREKVDSVFFQNVEDFRKIITNPDLNINSLKEYYDFQVEGYNLYSLLLKPVEKYLISKSLVISPDNTISYIPFEVFVTDSTIHNDLLYRTLPYVTELYKISYTYSATLLAETRKAEKAARNSLIAFAPEYKQSIDIDAIINGRQAVGDKLMPLPYALEEAGYVAKLTNGKLLSDSSSTVLNYIKAAGSYEIIHLAMHTVLNNSNPGLSKMIFSTTKDTVDADDLNLYEIYGVPLKAKMVVLSSCYTGSGVLEKGEGILSIARGFLSSGSKSVVMSLWEVNDASGTEIVKSFYRNLLKGERKSEALRRARISYLRSASQLNSHPYFWSTLVVYGDDSPLYYSKGYIFAGLIILALGMCAGLYFYLRKR